MSISSVALGAGLAQSLSKQQTAAKVSNAVFISLALRAGLMWLRSASSRLQRMGSGMAYLGVVGAPVW